MRWETVKERYWTRFDTLDRADRALVRSAMAFIISDANSMSMLDFLDGSARYLVNARILQATANAVETRCASRGATSATPHGAVLMGLLHDLRHCHDTLIGANHPEPAPSEPVGAFPPVTVRREPPADGPIRPRSRPHIAPDQTTWADMARSERRRRGIVLVRVEDGDAVASQPTAPPQPPPSTSPAPAVRPARVRSEDAAAAARTRGRALNRLLQLRAGVEVELVRHEEGEFTRSMRYVVRECLATGALTLRPVEDDTPREASISRFQPAEGLDLTVRPESEPSADTPVVGYSETPRRRLRL